MESFGRASTSVLRFPRRWTNEEPRYSTSLLWPVLGWRVVAPRPRGRELNLVQKAVLGLLRTGARAQLIAERLALDLDLVGLVVVELDQLGLADTLGRPTQRGLRVLETEQVEPQDESVIGWVFTDPWEGRIWPHFVDANLPFARTEVDKDNFQYLEESPGRGGRQQAFSLLPADREIVVDRPSDTDVAGAARAHRRRLRYRDEPQQQSVPVLPRVEFVSDSPEPFLLWTRCWSDQHGGWHLDDPLGGEESPRMRRQLEAKLDSMPKLRNWLSRVLGGDEQDTAIPQLQQRAQFDVEEQLTIRIREWPILHERLVAMQRALLECRLPDSPPDKWSDVPLKAQNAAEGILAEVFADAGKPHDLSTKDEEFNRQLLEEIAGSIGFATPLPKGLTGVRAGKILHAMQAGEGGLRPMALALLLSVPANKEHPYRRAAAAEPGLLRRIHELAEVRDEAGHYRSNRKQRRVKRTTLEPGKIESAVRTTLDLARHLLLV